MQGTEFLAEPQELGIDPAKLIELMDRVKQEVDDGLLPAVQVALAKDGKLSLFESYGEATNDSLFCIFSSTKAITSAAAWLLIQEGLLDITQKVSALIPEFVDNGAGNGTDNSKQDITIDQLFYHTAGFPHAPFRVSDWPDKNRRLARFSEWKLNWEPGTRFEYHPTSSMWIIAELIERITGETYDSFVRKRISHPLGLDDLWVGIPDEHHDRIATIVHVGEPLTPEDYRERGLPVPPATEVTPEAILNFNKPETRRIPVPGGGGVMSAAELALFYQGLLGNTQSGEKIWSDDIIAMATSPQTGDFTDYGGQRVNRALGVVISGDEKRNYRGFGHTNSATAFGHGGAGGQIGWADPATGISFAYCTNGHDQNIFRQGRRGISLSNRAAVCTG